MFRAHRSTSRVALTWRLLTPLLALALVLSSGVLLPQPVEAGGTSVISTVRTKQLSAEASMRRADEQIQELQKLRQNHTKLLKSAKKKLAKAVKQRRAVASKTAKADSRLSRLKLTFKRETLVRPDPAGGQKTDKPKLRKRITKLQKRVGKLEARVRNAATEVAQARQLKRSRMSRPTKARIEARKGERERAEDKLSSAIYLMTALSKDRADRFRAASVKSFSKPTKGKISQSYGCTGYATNPSRGSCKHFHDGLDIAAPVGTKVKASADGYVAYVGWSPWDTGKRAYIVIIGHANGYETVYAHLRSERRVRAGQKVKRGDVIGTIGMTGLTTGPHVHWEVKKGGTAVNPLRAGR